MRVRVRVRVSCERDELVLMVVGPRLKNLDDLETPCPEYPGLRPEYPDRVLQSGSSQISTSRSHSRRRRFSCAWWTPSGLFRGLPNLRSPVRIGLCGRFSDSADFRFR